MASDAGVEGIGEEGVELHAEQPTFGQKRSAAFHVGEEAFEPLAFARHDRLAEESAAFGAPDIEDVAEGGYVGNGEVGRGRQTVGEARPVDIERYRGLAADSRKVLQFTARIERADFRGEGDIDHCRSRHVAPGVVGIEAGDILFQLGGVEFAVVLRERDDFMAARLDGSGFVDIDMRRLAAYHPFAPADQPVDHHGVGLRASFQKEDISVGAFAGLKYFVARFGRILVITVAGSGHIIGLHQPAHHVGMRSGLIIAIKIYHYFAITSVNNHSAFPIKIPGTPYKKQNYMKIARFPCNFTYFSNPNAGVR